jgi:hypothetical protein
MTPLTLPKRCKSALAVTTEIPLTAVSTASALVA